MAEPISVDGHDYVKGCAMTRQGRRFPILLPPDVAEASRIDGAFTFVRCEDWELPPEDPEPSPPPTE